MAFELQSISLRGASVITDESFSITDVRAFLARYLDAVNTHQFDQVESLIHREAIIKFTDGELRGIDAIRAAFTATWATIREEVYSVSDVRVLYTDTHTACVVYQFHWQGKIDGEMASGSGFGTNIVVRTAVGLQILHEHLSA